MCDKIYELCIRYGYAAQNLENIFSILSKFYVKSWHPTFKRTAFIICHLATALHFRQLSRLSCHMLFGMSESTPASPYVHTDSQQAISLCRVDT